MNQQTLSSLRDWFLAYARRFERDGKLHPMKQLKVDHSLRVAIDARAIARDLGWSDEEQNTAEAVGLLHDTGRFSQFREFGTYRDSVSVNHAERGYQVLSEEKPLAGLAEEQTILWAVKLHNVKDIPAETSPKTRRYADLVRDADKLDIFHVIYDAIENDKLDQYPEITWDMKDPGAASPAVLDALRRREMVDYKEIRSLVDFQLVMLAWMPNLAYAPTCRSVLERNVLGRMAAALPDTPELRGIFQEFRRLLEDRCA